VCNKRDIQSKATTPFTQKLGSSAGPLMYGPFDLALDSDVSSESETSGRRTSRQSPFHEKYEEDRVRTKNTALEPSSPSKDLSDSVCNKRDIQSKVASPLVNVKHAEYGPISSPIETSQRQLDSTLSNENKFTSSAALHKSVPGYSSTKSNNNISSQDTVNLSKKSEGAFLGDENARRAVKSEGVPNKTISHFNASSVDETTKSVTEDDLKVVAGLGQVTRLKADEARRKIAENEDISQFHSPSPKHTDQIRKNKKPNLDVLTADNHGEDYFQNDQEKISTPRKTNSLSLIEKAHALVQDSNALRGYSPRNQDGTANPKDSLENYKNLLEDTLSSLDEVVELIDSDDESSMFSHDQEGHLELMDLDIEKSISHESYHDETAPLNRGSDENYMVTDLAYTGSDVSHNDEEGNVEEKHVEQGISTPNDLNRKLTVLENMMKSLVESTHESELINDLIADKMKLDKSLKSSSSKVVPSRNENTLTRKIKHLTAQTEALQSFVNSSLDQLEASRAAEREKQQQIHDLNCRMEETQEEIQSLKSSTALTIGNIHEDYSEALETARAEGSTKDTIQFLKERLDEEIAIREIEEKNHADEIASLMGSRDERAQQNEALKIKLKRIGKDLEEKHVDIANHSRELSSLKDKERGGGEQLHELSGTNKDLRVRLEKEMIQNKENKNQFRENIASLHDTIQALENSKADLENNLLSVKDEYSASQRQMKSALEKFEASAISDKEKLSALGKTVNGLTKEKKKLEEAVCLIAEDNKDLHSCLSRERENKKLVRDKQSENIISTENEVKSLNKEKIELKAKLGISKDEITKLSEKLTAERERRKEVALELARQSKSLEEALSQSNIEKEQINAVLTSCRAQMKEKDHTLLDEIEKRKAIEMEFEKKSQTIDHALDDCIDEKAELINKLNSNKNETVELNKTLNIEIERRQELELELERRSESFEQKQDDWMDEKAETVKTLNAYKEYNLNLNQELSAQIETREDLEAELEALQNAYDECEDDKVKHIELLDINKEEYEQLNSRYSEEVRKSKETDSRNEELSNALTELEATLDASKQEVENLQSSLTSEIAKKEAAERAYSMNISSLESVIKESEKVVHTLTEEIASSNKDIKHWKEQLDSEKSNRAEENMFHSKEMSKLLETANKTEQEANMRVEAANDEVLKNKRLLEAAVESNKQVEQEYIENLASQQIKSNKMDSTIKTLEHERSNLLEELAKLAESKALEDVNIEKKEKEHVYKIASLNDRIIENSNVMESQSNEISSLQDEIKRLYQSLKEEIEGKIDSEKLHVQEVVSLQEAAEKGKEDNNLLTMDIESITTELETSKKRIQLESQAKKRAEENVSSLKEEARKQEQVISELSAKFQSLRDEDASLIDSLESELRQRKESDHSLLEMKKIHEDETTKLQDKIKKKHDEAKILAKELLSIKSELNEKERLTAELNSTIYDIKKSVEEKQQEKDEEIKLMKDFQSSENKKLAGDLKSLKDKLLQEREEFKLNTAKLQKSLDSKVEKNNRLKDRFAESRSSYDKMKSTMEAELENRNSINTELRESLEKTKKEFSSRILNLLEEKGKIVQDADGKYDELESKISDLRLLNQSLTEQNGALHKKLDATVIRKEQLEEKRKKLHDSMKGTEATMRSELNELKSAMESLMSQKKEFADDKNSAKATIIKLEATIEQLECEIAERENEREVGGIDEDLMTDLRDENKKLKRRIIMLEERQHQRQPRNNLNADMNGPTEVHGDRVDGSTGGDTYVILWRTEKEQRLKAEEFAAAMAARAKAGFEDRDEKIIALRMKVSNLEAEKENIVRYKNASSSPSNAVVNPMLTNDGGDEDLTLALRERDDARQEAKRFRSIARKLNRQLQVKEIDRKSIEYDDA